MFQHLIVPSLHCKMSTLNYFYENSLHRQILFLHQLIKTDFEVNLEDMMLYFFIFEFIILKFFYILFLLRRF